MNGLIFLDTETTGIDLLIDRLVQVCYKHNDTLVSEYFKPPIPISVKSMSISHITNEMVKENQEFSNSVMKKDLQSLLKDNILVAHNALFDIDMLSKEGVKTERYIDTLKVVKFLDGDNLIPEYNLQYLRYFLDFKIDAIAHDAKGDVLVLEKLFEYLYEKMFEEYKDRDMILEKMMDISRNPLLLKFFNYGKHKGKKIEDVLSFDRRYMEWMLEQKLQNEYYDEDWIYTLKYHLNIK